MIRCEYETENRECVFIRELCDGGYSKQSRIHAALKQHHIIDETVPFAVVPCSIDLLHPDADTSRLIERIKADTGHLNITVGLVVVDTLSRALAGGNESGSCSSLPGCPPSRMPAASRSFRICSAVIPCRHEA